VTAAQQRQLRGAANFAKQLAASPRDPSVRELAVQATGLSAPTLEAITEIVRQARRVEGLVEVAGGPTGLDDPLPSLRARRRGRPARARADHSSSSGTPAGNGSI
jgi:hypothetical protein